jgi:hypothetical protein
MRQLSSLIVLIGLTATAACRHVCDVAVRPEPGKPPRNAVVVLEHDAKGECRISHATELHVARQTESVKWSITNHCHGEPLVEVGDFKMKKDGTQAPKECSPETPSGSENPIFEQKAAFGARSSFEARVKPDARPGTYAYCLYLNGKLDYDPDVIIRPFP